jgi:hypothetical protein
MSTVDQNDQAEQTTVGQSNQAEQKRPAAIKSIPIIKPIPLSKLTETGIALVTWKDGSMDEFPVVAYKFFFWEGDTGEVRSVAANCSMPNGNSSPMPSKRMTTADCSIPNRFTPARRNPAKRRSPVFTP